MKTIYNQPSSHSYTELSKTQFFPVSIDRLTNKNNENFPGHRLGTQIHIQTQIRLNTILTFATKHLMITNKDNLYLHPKAF